MCGGFSEHHEILGGRGDKATAHQHEQLGAHFLKDILRIFDPVHLVDQKDQSPGLTQRGQYAQPVSNEQNTRGEWPAHALDVIGPQHRQLIRNALQWAHVKKFVYREQLSSLLSSACQTVIHFDVVKRRGTSGILCRSCNIVVASTTTTAH
jgi:hypothetical protein